MINNNINVTNNTVNGISTSENKVESKNAQQSQESIFNTNDSTEKACSDCDVLMMEEALNEANVMMSKTVADALEAAYEEIGVSEDIDQKGHGHNTGEMEKYGGKKGDAWCVSFVSWLFSEGQNKTNDEIFNNDNGPEAVKTSVKTLKKYAKDNGYYKDKKDYNPKPGDIMVQTNKGASHVGIVTQVYTNEDGKQYVCTIEGNAGDKVSPKIYATDGEAYKSVSGFIDMNAWSNERPEMRNLSYLSADNVEYVDADNSSKKTV